MITSTKTNKKQNNQNKNSKKNNSQIVPRKRQNNRRPKGDSVSLGGQVKSMLNRGMGRSLAQIPSVARFSSVYMNPFQKESARLPVWPVLPTYLITTWATSTGATNASGIGWVSVFPANGVVRDANVAVVSDGNNANVFDPTDPGITTMSTNSNYTLGDFTFTNTSIVNPYQMRPVSVGVRVRYIGTELNRGGRLLMGIRPNRLNDQFPLAYSEISSWPGYKDLKFDNAWHGLHRQITQDQDFLFQAFYADEAEPGWRYNEDQTMFSLDTMPNINIFVISPVEKAPFEVQVYCHYEIIGTNLPQSKVEMPQTSSIQTVVAKKTQVDHISPNTDMLKNTSGKSDSNFLSGFFKEVGGEIVKDLSFGLLG